MERISGLGYKIVSGITERDAVHVAIIPCEAGESLGPGTKVFVDRDDGGCAKRAFITPAVGVVDPFLSEVVNRGERFWLMLFPGTITSLRHEWSHPVFPIGESDEVVQESKAWLSELADRSNISYEELIEMAVEGEDIYLRAETPCDELRNSDSARVEFWRNVEIVTGRWFSVDHIANAYFTCGC